MRARLHTGLVAAAFGLAGALSAARAPAAGPPVTVAVALDLTGAGAALGEAERIGLKIAEREVGLAGGIGGRPLRVVVLDSATSAATAARGARHAIEQERALVLIGASTGAPTVVLIEAAQRAEIPLLALAEGPPPPDPAASRHWVFQVPPGNALVAEALARDLARRNLRRIGWLEAEGPIGAAGRSAFAAAARRFGLTVVARERVAEGPGDPAAAVTRVVAARPQALVVWAIPPLAGALAQRIRDLAPGLAHYQSHAAATGTFLALAGTAAAGVRTVNVKLPTAEALPEGDPQRPLLLEFLTRLRAQPGGAPGPFAGYGYDALRLAAAALERALGGREGEGVEPPIARRRYDAREALEATRGYVGVTGIYTYDAADHAGLDERALIVVEGVVPPGAKTGEWQPVR